jgi:hypothetical protein
MRADSNGEGVCPGCDECGLFTLHLLGGVLVFARCQNCGREVPMQATAPQEGHADPHFGEGSICVCDCGDCTVYTCGCSACPCENPADHMMFVT